MSASVTATLLPSAAGVTLLTLNVSAKPVGITASLERPLESVRPSGTVKVAVNSEETSLSLMEARSAGLPNCASIPAICVFTVLASIVPVRLILSPCCAPAGAMSVVSRPTCLRCASVAFVGCTYTSMSAGSEVSSGFFTRMVCWMVVPSLARKSLPSATCAPFQLVLKRIALSAVVFATKVNVPATVPMTASSSPFPTAPPSRLNPGTSSVIWSAMELFATMREAPCEPVVPTAALSSS